MDYAAKIRLLLEKTANYDDRSEVSKFGKRFRVTRDNGVVKDQEFDTGDVGDYIKVHDKEHDYQGIIDDIKTFHLIIKTDKGETITYPNSLILKHIKHFS